METNTVACPRCGHRKTLTASSQVVICPVCNHVYLYNYGTVISSDMKKKEPVTLWETLVRNKWVIFTILAGILIVLAVRLYRDFSDYRKVVNRQDIPSCERYLEKHENGLWNDKVFRMYDDIYFKATEEIAAIPARYDEARSMIIEYIDIFGFNGANYSRLKGLSMKCDYHEAMQLNQIAPIYNFFSKYPESPYAQTLLAKKDSLYGAILSRFDEKANTSPYQSSARFFRKILEYMNATNGRDICIRFAQELRLKNWDDYPSYIRDMYTAQSFASPGLYVAPDIPDPQDSKPPEIKANFSSERMNSLEERIRAAIELNLEYLYGEKLILVRKLEPTDNVSDVPLINITYKFKNSEDVLGLPDLYIHYEYSIVSGWSMKRIDRSTFKGYLLGLTAEFNLKAALPGGEARYTLTHYTPELKEHYSGEIDELYGAFLDDVFSKYSDWIMDHFGISE